MINVVRTFLFYIFLIFLPRSMWGFLRTVLYVFCTAPLSRECACIVYSDSLNGNEKAKKNADTCCQQLPQRVRSLQRDSS
jgi:hypothetical protein